MAKTLFIWCGAAIVAAMTWLMFTLVATLYQDHVIVRQLLVIEQQRQAQQPPAAGR